MAFFYCRKANNLALGKQAYKIIKLVFCHLLSRSIELNIKRQVQTNGVFFVLWRGRGNVGNLAL